MYKVKVDEKLLCFTGSVNGMEYVTDPDVKLVVNGVDSFSFAIYPQHPLYKEIECKVSRVKIWRDSKLLFYGEVTGYSQDMYGIRTYDCEGALAWLNDLHFSYAISGATPKEVLYWYIKLYNQKLRDKSKSFELGTVTVHKALTQSGTEGTIARSSGVYPSFWEEIQDKLLDSFGGILRVRYVGSDTCAGYIDWLAIPDGTCSQDVRYAKNLLNCDWTYDCTALATAIVPLGKRKDSSGDNEVRLTIDKADDDDATFMIQYMTGTDDLVKSGNMVYSKSRMEKYGLIQQAVTFDDITDAGTLAYQGAVWLRQNGKAASTIRAEAIDLADIDESVEHFTHGDYVRTNLPGDSAESLFPITAIEIPIAAPENAKLTVGTQESGITSGSGGQGGGSIADAGSGADAMAHTHSNKGVLDKITEQDYADFKGAVNKAHIHANKDTLDKIDETAWLTVYGQSHRHDNEEVLDRITAQDYADFKASANKAHVHDNKSTLDKIDETSWLLVYGQTHEHENQSVLDKTTASYTAAEKTKLAGIAAGAEVNQNAFSTIASGSARYTATSKTAAFVIEGEDGTSVTLSTNGRATISSHSHSNKAVLDATTASYTTAEQTKLKGVSAGAEVNQNAFSTIATGSARYAATAKQSAFLIDGDGGTSVSLDTKTGRLTVSSHTHDNKAVLDKLTAQDYSDFKGTVNKAHTHSNRDTLDKLDVEWWAMWLSAYGNMHTHSNKSALDKITDALVTKLSNMDLSKYLPLAGGAMTGDIDLATNKADLLVGSQPATQSTTTTAVAGGAVSPKLSFSVGLPVRKSIVGTWLDENTVYHNIISVRHRNGHGDGTNYGMYLRSLLTSNGNLIWNKQTAADTWQGERTLLDSSNYTSYAAKSNHTHAAITNSSQWASGAANAAQWVRLGTVKSSGNFSTAVISVWSGDGANGNATQNSWFDIHIKDGWQSTESATKACGVTVYRTRCKTVSVKVIPTAHDTYTVWVYLPWTYWNSNYSVHGKYSSWTPQVLKQTAEPEGTGADTAYFDQAFLTSTVANATTWNGLINDVDTYNSSDTWILVKKDNRIQHRYAGELDVNSAKTLTDSGWVTCPLAVTGNTTYPSSSSIIKVRKYGKLVRLEAAVKYKTAFGTGHNVATIPEGYRPSVLQREHGITPTATEKNIFDALLLDTGSLSFIPAGSGSSTFNPANSYECRMTYFID
ncbi:MAG: phage tail protein [Ruminococcus callidus]|uniref:phage tail protein n=1 Tax=Ruminococcus callidus TaxID=40519 RepID=UPI00399FFB9C